MIVKWLLTFLLMIKSDSWCICYELSNDISEPETCSLMDSVNKILNITVTITSEIDAVSFAENVPIRREYDFVIVGSGPSGCVLANRLSDANYSVLLLEAGSAENPIITNIPMSAANLQHSEYNWNYATEPQNKACLCMFCHSIFQLKLNFRFFCCFQLYVIKCHFVHKNISSNG